MHTAADHAADHTPTDPVADLPNVANAGGGASGTFTLRLQFSGLCLFVPEPADKTAAPGTPARTHVLMMNFGDDVPPSGGTHPAPEHAHVHEHGYSSHPKHYCMLYMEKGRPGPETPPLNRKVGISLRDTVLQLPRGGTGGGAGEPLGEDVLPLHEITAITGLPREWVGHRPGRQVAARVVLTGGGPTPPLSWAWWDIEHPDGTKEEKWKVAGDVEWEVPDVAGPVLRLVLRDVDTGQHTVRTLELHPEGGEVRLRFCCLPLNELPGGTVGPTAKPGDTADHFVGFFELFPGVRPPRLVLNSLPPQPTPATVHPSPMTMHTKRCTAAQVRLADRESV